MLEKVFCMSVLVSDQDLEGGSRALTSSSNSRHSSESELSTLDTDPRAASR